MRKFLIIFFLALFSFVGISQKNFEGIITYSINYNEIPKEMVSVTSQLPTVLIVKYHESMKKEEVISEQSSKITITDLVSNKSFVLMTLFGEKIALIRDEENKKICDLYSECNVVITKESKKIGDFECTKALLYFPKIKEPSEVYYTDEYKANDGKFSKIGGIPLEFSTVENGMLITYTMLTIENKSLKMKEFEVDKSYTILTPEELQKQFGME